MCDDQGIRYLVADDEEEEAWDDILEDMDDPWMREPTAAPEILEQQAAEVAAAAGGAGAVSQAEPSFAYSKDGGFVDIGVPELIELMNKRLEPLQVQAPACTVIDVRSSMEFSLRKLPSSINIPVKQLTRDAVSGFTTAAVVVVVGSGDDRSRQVSACSIPAAALVSTVLLIWKSLWSRTGAGVPSAFYVSAAPALLP